MAAQNTHENTEEIIDLTELIEKGSVPETDEAVESRTADGDADLHSHMRSLNDQAQHSEAEAEIDHLLAQMDSMDEDATAEMSFQPVEADDESTSEAADTQADATTGMSPDFPPVRMPDGHIVDPHEELHMPGMGDVDSLLNSLDIPPQPRAQGAAAPSSKDTDDAVDKMLGSLGGASCPTPEDFTPNPEQSAQADPMGLDELLAAGTMPEPVISDELEALLREANPATAQPAPSKPRPIEQRAAAPAQEAPAAAPQAAAPAHDLNEDLDALLHSIMADQPNPSPAQTQAQPAASQEPAQTTPYDALDAQAAPQTPASAPASESDSGPTPAPVPEPGTPESAAPAADSASDPVSDLAADLDMLLASINGPESADAGKDTDQTAASDLAKSNETLEFDLDALLAAADAEERGLQPASTAEPQAEAVQPSVEGVPAAHQEPPVEAQPQAAPTAPELSLDDILDANGAFAPDEMANMLDPTDSAAAVAAAALAAASVVNSAPASTAGQIPAQDMSALVERLDQYAAQLQQADARVSALESAVAEARAEAEQARTEADEARATAQQAQTALDEALASAQSAHENVAQTATEALHTAQGAAEAAASAAAQQQADKPESTSSPEDLFATDHPLHQRLLELISATAATAAAEAAATAARQAADEAVQSAMPQAEDKPQAEHEDPALLETLLDERMHGVNLTVKGASARLDSVEDRLDELEPRFNDRVEKAAAAAAARILREEIGRLLESE